MIKKLVFFNLKKRNKNLKIRAMSEGRLSYGNALPYKVNLRIEQIGMSESKNCKMIISWKVDRSLETTMPVALASGETTLDMKEEFDKTISFER